MFIFSYLSVTFDLLANLPYAFRVLKGDIRPHPFTWFVWTLLTLMMAVIQYLEGAGGGGWLLVSTTCLNILVCVLSFKYATKDITRSDYVVLVLCLLCIPLYFVFKMPLASAVVITLIDSASFIPMLRKSVHDPLGESAMFQWMMVVAYACSFLAMENHSLSVILFPSVMVVMHGFTCLFLLYLRRRVAVS